MSQLRDDFINLDFSSFKKKDPYQPPNMNTFNFNVKPQQKLNGKKPFSLGQWADDVD